MLDYTDMRPEEWDAQTPAAREIRQYLDRTHQTAKQLAETAGIVPSRISDCLAGKGLHPRNLKKISMASGIPVTRLLGQEGAPKLSAAQAAALAPTVDKAVALMCNMDDRAPLGVSRLTALSALLPGFVESGAASYLAAYIELVRKCRTLEKRRPITPHLNAAAVRGTKTPAPEDDPPVTLDAPTKAEQTALASWRAELSDAELKRDFARFQTEQAIRTVFDSIEGG